MSKRISKSTRMAIGMGKTEQDFRIAAQNKANNFWGWLITAGIVYWFLGWWFVIPITLAVLKVIQSVCASKIANDLEELEKNIDMKKAQEIVKIFG